MSEQVQERERREKRAGMLQAMSKRTRATAATAAAAVVISISMSERVQVTAREAGMRVDGNKEEQEVTSLCSSRRC